MLDTAFVEVRETHTVAHRGAIDPAGADAIEIFGSETVKVGTELHTPWFVIVNPVIVFCVLLKIVTITGSVLHEPALLTVTLGGDTYPDPATVTTPVNVAGRSVALAGVPGLLGGLILISGIPEQSPPEIVRDEIPQLVTIAVAVGTVSQTSYVSIIEILGFDVYPEPPSLMEAMKVTGLRVPVA